MDDPVLVRMFHGRADLPSVPQHGFHRHAVLANKFGKRAPLHEFHGDKQLAIFFPHFINRANVRMVQRRGRAGFIPEAFRASGIPRDLGGEKL